MEELVAAADLESFQVIEGFLKVTRL